MPPSFGHMLGQKRGRSVGGLRHSLALLSCPSPTEIWRTLASQEKIAVAAPVWPVNCRAWRVCPEVLPRTSVCNEIDRGGRLRTKNTHPHTTTEHITSHTRSTRTQNAVNRAAVAANLPSAGVPLNASQFESVLVMQCFTPLWWQTTVMF